MLAHGWRFTPDTPASSTTKTGRPDIAEILLKVAINTINQIKSTVRMPLLEREMLPLPENIKHPRFYWRSILRCIFSVVFYLPLLAFMFLSCSPFYCLLDYSVDDLIWLWRLASLSTILRVISWWSVLSVEETGVPGKMLPQVNEKLYHIIYFSNTPRQEQVCNSQF